MGLDWVLNFSNVSHNLLGGIKCAFGSTLRSQNTCFQVENLKSVLGNKMQTCVLEKLIFQIQKPRKILCSSWARAFAKSYSALSILQLEVTVNFPKCALCFKRQIMLFAIPSSKTRSHLSTIVDITEVNWVLILDENCGVTNQHNDEKAASNGGAEVGLDS